MPSAVQGFNVQKFKDRVGGETSTFRELSKRLNDLQPIGGDKSALLAGIVLAGLFVYLFQTHPFEEFALILEVIAIAFRKVTGKASRSGIAQGVNQFPNSVSYQSWI